MVQKKKSRKPRSKPYSKGELNYIVDAIIHPMYRRSEAFRIVDGFVHGIIEEDPPTSLEKFILYNWREIAKRTAKQKR